MAASDLSAPSPLRRLALTDERWLVAVARRRTRGLEWVMRAVTRLSGAAAQVVYCTICVVVAARSQPALPLAMCTGTLCAFGAAMVLKRVCRRARPNEGIDGFRAVTANPDAFSFPSGHTASAFGNACAVWLVAPDLGAALLAFAALVGVSRVVLGAHYPFDVLAGAVLGGTIGATLGALALPLAT